MRLRRRRAEIGRLPAAPGTCGGVGRSGAPTSDVGGFFGNSFSTQNGGFLSYGLPFDSQVGFLVILPLVFTIKLARRQTKSRHRVRWLNLGNEPTSLLMS